MNITQFTERLKFVFFERIKARPVWDVFDIRKEFELAVKDVKPTDNWSVKNAKSK